jgi:hypothetical protein
MVFFSFCSASATLSRLSQSDSYNLAYVHKNISLRFSTRNGPSWSDSIPVSSGPGTGGRFSPGALRDSSPLFSLVRLHAFCLLDGQQPSIFPTIPFVGKGEQST